MDSKHAVTKWDTVAVSVWLRSRGYSDDIIEIFSENDVDGFSLLRITEDDLKHEPLKLRKLGTIKHLIDDLKQLHSTRNMGNGCSEMFSLDSTENLYGSMQCSPGMRKFSQHLQPEIFKMVMSAAYCSIVFYLTALVMVIVNERVPDMEKYPPLPDLFLDNVPFIPWGFHMAECILVSLITILSTLLVFHKHRFIICRRLFSLTGTIFLLRCVCMLITSLSVPNPHFKCHKYPNSTYIDMIWRAGEIYFNGGMSLRGVRSCGDYMFSGHTTMLTLTNLFIDEYSPRDYPVIRTFGWVMNLFGIFFVMAGHEHYSLDVFVAFYLSTRLFVYYHTLADSQSRLQYDQKRVRIWFPLFSYFESHCDGAVPNDYEWPLSKLLLRPKFRQD